MKASVSRSRQGQVDNSWVVAEIGDYYGTGVDDILWRQAATGNT